MTSRQIGRFGASALALSLLGCADKDDKTVAGRTASVAATPASEVRGAVRRVERIEAATGARRWEFEARAVAPGASPLLLLLPSGEELRLDPQVAAASGEHPLSFAFHDSGDGGLPARFSAGGYTFLAELAQGRDVTATVLAGAPPTAPELLAPRELELVGPGPLEVQWSSSSARHDVRLLDALTGAEVLSVRDVVGQQLTLEAPPLEPGRRYCLEVSAVDAPWGAPARAEAGTWILVDGAQ